MKLNRRTLLGNSLVAGFSSVLPFGVNARDFLTDFRLLVAMDGVLMPLLAAGEGLLVDTRTGVFQGEGVYLYPAWGQPRPYLVREEAVQGAIQLGFYHPLTRALMWRHSLAGDRQFAGHLAGQLSVAEVAASRIPMLRLPVRPVVDEALSG